MGGLPYGDIIVIGAIAAFIILRYRAMLGEKTGRDAEATPVLRPLQEYERVIQLPERTAAKIAPAKDYGTLTETFAAMRAIDRLFTPEEFLEGARGAYEMVIEAFNNGDRDTLKMLLSKEIYQHFDDALTQQKTDGKIHHTTLTAINESTVTDAVLTGSKARLTVKFISEQILLTRDEQGTIVSGDPSNQQSVEDHWVFERSLASADPSWKVIET